jgi:C-terminal processing protease CtpA/Prc
MNRPLSLALLIALTVFVPTHSTAQEERIGALTFESSGSGAIAGWQLAVGKTSLDSVVVHGGRYAARLEHEPGAPGASVIITRSLPVAFQADTVELRGWLKTENVMGWAGLWVREDGKNTALEFDNMQRRNVKGTTDWTEYRVRLPLHPKARTIYMGVLLAGDGKVWADDLDFLLDGRPVEDAPVVVPAPDPVESDTEFDAGSLVATTSLSESQIDDLALLGKVWGFAKYHHPRIVDGQVNWDYELFRVLPGVLAARDRAAAERILEGWLARVGDPPECAPCATVPGDAQLPSDVAWIHDPEALGADLSQRLEAIYRNRPRVTEQYYVSLAPGVGNPDFSNEAAYGKIPASDAGYRLLALFRFWNIVEYWYPNRDIIGENWDGVLREFVPRIMGAPDAQAYGLTMMQLIARVHDTHANLWSSLSLRPPAGPAVLPVTARFLEGQAVVTGYSNATLGPATGLRPGDVIQALDGTPVDSLVAAWQPFYAASNEPTALRDIALSLTRGPEGPVRVSARGAHGAFTVNANRVPTARVDQAMGRTHDLPGEAFQLLTPEVAYLKLSSVKSAETADYIRRAAGTKVLVVDIRNYPSEFVVFSLGGHFVTEPTPFARFTGGNVSNPGTFEWSEPISIQPLGPHYEGKVVVLVDEVSQSQAEYTAMAYRAAGALVVGSTTAGADGNVSSIPLPAGLSTMISGIGVFYPDKTPTQRVGILPDLVVRPTISGIRAGRDEVLEAGVSRALGREFRLPGR